MYSQHSLHANRASCDTKHACTNKIVSIFEHLFLVEYQLKQREPQRDRGAHSFFFHSAIIDVNLKQPKYLNVEVFLK